MPVNDITDMTSFKWATVVTNTPLSIKLDGDTNPLALVPDSLIDPKALATGDRVRVELSIRKCIIHGRSSGIKAPRYGTVVAPSTGFQAVNSGPLTVRLDGDTGTIVVSVAKGPHYPPQGGDRVLCTSDGFGSYLATPVDHQRLLSPMNGWTNYSSGWAFPIVTRTGEGIVALSGLIAKGTGALTKGTVVAVLPADCRPDYDLLVGGDDSDTTKQLVIRANGNVELYDTVVGSYISLSGICFPAAGVATWTSFAFINSWANYTEAGYNFGPLRFWRSLLTGQVYVNGAIAGGVASSGICITPTGFISAGQQILYTVGSNAGYAGVRARQSTTDFYYDSGAGTSRVAICVVYRSGTAGTDPSASWSVMSMGASWVDYDTTAGTGYGTAAIMQYQGITYTYGLLKGGVIGSAPLAWTIYRWFWPRPSFNDGFGSGLPNAQLQNVASNSARGRVDFRSDGSFIPLQGSTSWLSLAGLNWVTD